MKKMLLTGVALGLGLAFATAASAQIKIGVAGPITGPNAAFGAQLKNGAEQAVEDINAAGGVNGQKLVLVHGDDVSDPKQGVSVANKFAAEGVKLVVGHFNSGVSIPSSALAQVFQHWFVREGDLCLSFSLQTGIQLFGCIRFNARTILLLELITRIVKIASQKTCTIIGPSLASTQVAAGSLEPGTDKGTE